MADLSITANLIIPSSPSVVTLVASEAIAVNDILFRLTSTTYGTRGHAGKAFADTAERATAIGIAITKAAAMESVHILQLPRMSFDGDTFPATTATAYVVSANAAGKLAPAGDLTTGDHCCIVGVSFTARNFTFTSTYAGVVV